MSDGWADLDAERLPWLTDDLPRRRGRRVPALALGAVCALLLAGAGFWRGDASLAALQDLARGERSHAAVNAAPQARSPALPTRFYSLRSDIKPAGPVAVASVAAIPTDARPVLAGGAAARPPSAPAAARAPLPLAAAPALPSFSARPESTAAASGTGDLGRLNNSLASLYSQSWSRADAAERAQLLRTQDRFVARLGSCTTAACRRSAYLARMRQVSEIIRNDGQTARSRYATDSNLAALNAQLASLYSQSWGRAGADKRARLLKTQDRFVHRLDGCRSAACLNGAYVARMREVSEIMAARS